MYSGGQESVGFSGAGVQEGREPLYGSWKPIMGPQQGQEVLYPLSHLSAPIFESFVVLVVFRSEIRSHCEAQAGFKLEVKLLL